MRIAALQCNFEDGRTLEVADRWKKIGFNVEQVFHPMADSYSALFDLKQHGALLQEYLARLKRNGLRAILYLNVHILGPSLALRKDEWAQRSADGGFPLFYDTYHPCCVNSPWRDHYLQVLRDLMPFDIDGVFLDGPVFIQGGCHCRHCRARYRREEGHPMAKHADLRDFCRRSLDDFLRASYRQFKRIKPDGIHYMNMGVMHLTASYLRLPDALDYNDLVGTEGGFMFYLPARNAPLFRPGVEARVMEAIAPRKPRVIFMAADQKPWSWLPHGPVETKLCVASSVANGANIWYGLHGSTRLLNTPGGRAGQEMIRFLADHEEYFDRTVSAARVAVMYSLATERRYRSQTAASDLYGRDRDRVSSAYLGDFHASFGGVCEMLARSSIPFDVATDLAIGIDPLRRYECLLLPTSACLDRKTLSVLRAYVARGGKLISTFDTSLFDGRGVRRKDFGLADVFGVSFAGETLALKDFNYFRIVGKEVGTALRAGRTQSRTDGSGSRPYHEDEEIHPVFEGLAEEPLLPAPSFGVAVTPCVTAHVLARFLKPLPGRYVELTAPDRPAVVLNRFGRGASLYLAGTFGEQFATHSPPEYRRLFANAVRHFTTNSLALEGALGNVELVVRRQKRGRKERLIIHLINYAGLPQRPFEQVYPQRRLNLRIRNEGRFSTARALVAGRPCRLRKQTGVLRVELPELREHEMIVLE